MKSKFFFMKNNTLNKSQKVVFAYLIFIFMNCCMLISCDNSRDKESNIAKFQQKVEIKPSVTYIDNASKQLDLVLMDKYYVVQNDVEAHQKQLSVYDKVTNKYLYGFAIKGHGKNETMAMDMVQNPNGDTLEIIDQAKYKILKYKVTS